MVNAVTLIGRLTRDAEPVEAAQTPMTRMRVVTDQGYRDAEGVWQEKPEFHSVVAFGRLAEVCAAYCGKGRLVYFSGRLRTRDYDGSDGLRRHATEIVVEHMKLLGRGPSAVTDAINLGSSTTRAETTSVSTATDDVEAIDTDPPTIAGAVEPRRGNGRRPAATASV